MALRRAILFFFFKLAVLYGALMIPWHGLERAYLAGLRGVGESCFGKWSTDGAVFFEPPGAEPQGWTAALTLRRAGSPLAMRCNFNARYPFLATALTVSLILATPIPWRRRCVALGVGLILVNAFALARLWLTLLSIFAEPPLSLYALSPFWSGTLRLATLVFAQSSETVYVVPFMIWAMVALRRSDWQEFVTKPPPAAIEPVSFG